MGQSGGAKRGGVPLSDNSPPLRRPAGGPLPAPRRRARAAPLTHAAKIEWPLRPQGATFTEKRKNGGANVVFFDF